MVNTSPNSCKILNTPSLELGIDHQPNEEPPLWRGCGGCEEFLLKTWLLIEGWIIFSRCI